MTAVDFNIGEMTQLPLTWAQSAVLEPIRRMGDNSGYYNLTGRALFQHPVPLSQCHDLLRALISSIDILRTKFVYDENHAVQLLLGSGSVEFDHHEIDIEYTDEQAEAVERGLESTHIASGTWCYRGTLLYSGTTAVGIIIVFSHLAVDAWARDLVMDAVARMFGEATDSAVSAGPPVQPCEQLGRETGSTVQMFSDAALNHWQRHLESAPDSVFGRPPEAAPEKPRWVMCRLLSEAASTAAQLVADRLNVSTSTVLLAASALLLDQFSVHTSHMFQLIVGNRFTDHDRRVLTTMTQDGILAIDVNTTGFDELVNRVFVASLTAYQFGSYDYSRLCTLRDAERSRRGFEPELESYFNDIRPNGRWPDLPTGTNRAHLRRLQESTTISCPETWDDHEVRYFAHLMPHNRACDLSIIVDTAFVPVESMLTGLRCLESLLVESAWDSLPPRRVQRLFQPCHAVPAPWAN